MNIALIAHDQKKEEIVRLAIAYKHLLKKHRLFATGTTGKQIAKATGLPVRRFCRAPSGEISRSEPKWRRTKWTASSFCGIR